MHKNNKANFLENTLNVHQQSHTTADQVYFTRFHKTLDNQKPKKKKDGWFRTFTQSN